MDLILQMILDHHEAIGTFIVTVVLGLLHRKVALKEMKKNGTLIDGK